MSKSIKGAAELALPISATALIAATRAALSPALAKPNNSGSAASSARQPSTLQSTTCRSAGTLPKIPATALATPAPGISMAMRVAAATRAGSFPCSIFNNSGTPASPLVRINPRAAATRTW